MVQGFQINDPLITHQLEFTEFCATKNPFLTRIRRYDIPGWIYLPTIPLRKKATAIAEAEAQVAAAEGAAKAQIAAARGQAESQRLLQQSVTPQILQLKQLEVQRELIAKWNGQLPKIAGSGGTILQLPAMPEEKKQ